MERREGRKDQLPVDPRHELERCGKENTLFDMELQAYKRLFTDDDNMDESSKILLTALFSKQNKIIMSQKMKPGDKPDLPLLPIMKFKRPEQLLRRETGRVLIQNDKDAVAFKERCKLSNKKRAGFEKPKKQKGKGLLIHYVDIDVHEVVGKGCKKQNGKEHLVEPGDVRKDSEKTIFELHKRDSEHHLISENDEVREKDLELEKKRKGKGLLVEPDDCDVGETDRYNAVCENSGKTSKENIGTASKERSELDRGKGKDLYWKRNGPILISTQTKNLTSYQLKRITLLLPTTQRISL
ncbi:hypothetical protein CASFOL_016176 [Castilleja foliolosa]|uniref:Uncharacterized protein n=1 Tax=Castilleja foliolosa TaxID=1961234 RepID=A0ABD3DGG6_9LAMI